MSFLCMEFIRNTALAAYLCTSSAPVEYESVVKPHFNEKLLSSYTREPWDDCYTPNNAEYEQRDLLHDSTLKNVFKSTGEEIKILVCVESGPNSVQQGPKLS